MVETSLGYFINPLVTVLMGVVILGERLRPACSGWRSASAALACVVLTVDYGHPPWIALVLAFSFGTYGLAKKQAGAEAVESLTLETLLVAPLALGYLAWLVAHDRVDVRHRGRRARPAPDVGRHRHGRAADVLRRRGHPGARW